MRLESCSGGPCSHFQIHLEDGGGKTKGEKIHIEFKMRTICILHKNDQATKRVRNLFSAFLKSVFVVSRFCSSFLSCFFLSFFLLFSFLFFTFV